MTGNASKLTGMKARLDEVAKNALLLPVGDQEVLAEKLVGNLVSRVPADLKKRQLAEVMRRRADIFSWQGAGDRGGTGGARDSSTVRVMEFVFHPDALAEFKAEIAYYEGSKPGWEPPLLKRRCESSNWCACFHESDPRKRPVVRSVMTKRFPFLIYYEVLEDKLWIWAVMHAAREPGGLEIATTSITSLPQVFHASPVHSF